MTLLTTFNEQSYVYSIYVNIAPPFRASPRWHVDMLCLLLYICSRGFPVTALVSSNVTSDTLASFLESFHGKVRQLVLDIANRRIDPTGVVSAADTIIRGVRIICTFE